MSGKAPSLGNRRHCIGTRTLLRTHSHTHTHVRHTPKSRRKRSRLVSWKFQENAHDYARFGNGRKRCIWDKELELYFDKTNPLIKILWHCR